MKHCLLLKFCTAKNGYIAEAHSERLSQQENGWMEQQSIFHLFCAQKTASLAIMAPGDTFYPVTLIYSIGFQEDWQLIRNHFQYN